MNVTSVFQDELCRLVCGVATITKKKINNYSCFVMQNRQDWAQSTKIGSACGTDGDPTNLPGRKVRNLCTNKNKSKLVDNVLLPINVTLQGRIGT